MFDYINGLAPKAFNDAWCTNLQRNPHFNLRNQDDFYVPHTLPYLDKYPDTVFPNVWNSLPSHLKLIRNKNKFKTDLKKHLLDSMP